MAFVIPPAGFSRTEKRAKKDRQRRGNPPPPPPPPLMHQTEKKKKKEETGLREDTRVHRMQRKGQMDPAGQSIMSDRRRFFSSPVGA